MADEEADRKNDVHNRLEFLQTTMSGISAAIAGAAIVMKLLNSDVKLPTVHWTLWVCGLSAIYAVACYVRERTASRHEKWTFLRLPTWTQLRGFGDHRVSRVSYWALAGIPMLAYLFTENPLHLQIPVDLRIPLSLKLAFFASWFFSLALILFAVGIPKDIRDQNPLQHAKNVNLVLNDVQSGNIVIEVPQSSLDPVLDRSLRELRAAIFLFFLIGLSIAVTILFRSAWFVAEA